MSGRFTVVVAFLLTIISLPRDGTGQPDGAGDAVTRRTSTRLRRPADTSTDTTLPLAAGTREYRRRPTNPTHTSPVPARSTTGDTLQLRRQRARSVTDRASAIGRSGHLGAIYSAVRFTNNTGATITSLNVSLHRRTVAPRRRTPTP